MRLGLTELLLILLIGLLVFGPAVAGWLGRWSRQARARRAVEARRRAAWEAERRARRDFILHRFQIAAAVFAVLTGAALVYSLGFRPIEAEPQSYALPAAEAQTAPRTVTAAETLPLAGYQAPDCIRVEDGWVYAAARPLEGEGSVLLRLREDGSAQMPVLTEEGVITSFDFDPAGDIWYTVLTGSGGALCRASHDDWGASTEQVVAQIDGRALSCPAAVAAGPDGRVYFTEAARLSGADSLEDALRTELMAHTATGWVYVYDPAARSVQRLLGGVAGAAGLALSPDGETIYVADLGSRCVWAAGTAARELTAGGQGCTLFAGELPGCPAALAAGEDGAVYVGFRWAAAAWLEERAAEPGLRGVALRAPGWVQRGLFEPCATAAQRYGPDGLLQEDYAAGPAVGTALALNGNRLYLPGGAEEISYLRF